MPTLFTAVADAVQTAVVNVPLLHRSQLRLLQSLSAGPADLNDGLSADAMKLVEGGLAALVARPAEHPGAGRRWRCEITEAGRRFLIAGP